MKERILQTLKSLRAYAVEKGLQVSLLYHEEESALMRFANSAISLNTNEHIVRLEITAYRGNQRAVYELITEPTKLDEMKKGIDTAAELAALAQPLTYQPTMPNFKADFIDEQGYDETLAKLANEEKLAFFNRASAGLETDDLKLSGIFSSGTNIWAMVSTSSEFCQFFKTSDAGVTVVLAHATLKWEVQAEQSAHQKTELNAEKLHGDLAFLVERYQKETPQQIPLGSYDIVFGHAAIAEIVRFLGFIGFSGGALKRGFSCLNEEKIGQKVFSDKMTIVDDPAYLQTFPLKHDFIGMERKTFPVVEKGVFKGFAWVQDDADEFGEKPTGHTVPAYSLVVSGGDHEVNSLEELVRQPREKDLLYIPFLHYMNLVNPSKGIITGSSRFGALLLKKDGSVVVPYNVRLTQSMLDIFGDKVAWIAKKTEAYNTSSSYGARNPTAVMGPLFMRVNDLEISHSNSSY